MTLVAGEALSWMKGKGAGEGAKRRKVARVVVGTCLSSLTMRGFSITALALPSEMRLMREELGCIDLPVQSTFWPGATNVLNVDSVFVARPSARRKKAECETDKDEGKDVGKAELGATAAKAESAAALLLRTRLKCALEAVAAAEKQLNAFDAAVGDGDIGTGAARAARRALSRLPEMDFENDLKGAVQLLSDVSSDAFGGTFGELISFHSFVGELGLCSGWSCVSSHFLQLTPLLCSHRLPLLRRVSLRSRRSPPAIAGGRLARTMVWSHIRSRQNHVRDRRGRERRQNGARPDHRRAR